jgi:hypothetical protein
MDGTQFDDLITQLSGTPLTRAKVLRRLATSAAALVGLTFAGKPSVAKTQKNAKEERVCLWSATGGRSQKKAATKVKKLLKRNPCARKGRCTASTPALRSPSSSARRPNARVTRTAPAAAFAAIRPARAAPPSPSAATTGVSGRAMPRWGSVR